MISHTESLGRAIAARRVMRGLSRGELAEQSGISYPYLSGIETGVKEPSLSVLRVLAEALATTPSALFALSDSIHREVNDATAV